MQKPEMVEIKLNPKEAWTMEIDIDDEGAAIIRCEKCDPDSHDPGDCQCSTQTK
jgi:hypothetical protein